MERMWWLCGAFIFLLSVEKTWAMFSLPWDRLIEAVHRYGMVDHLVCEHTACVVTWKSLDGEGFDSDYCTFKPRKRSVVCRYVYENHG